MKKQFKLVTLLILVFGLLVIFSNNTYHLPGNQQDYEPVQPIDFSHRLHAGEMSISCMYCHSGAETSLHAGIPATSVCMNCHKYVSTPLDESRLEEEQAANEGRDIRQLTSSEIVKIYTAMGYNADLTLHEEDRTHPIQWIKVHNLPDFVYFSHKPHIAAGVDCSDCHGDVKSMERIKQVEDLSMGWCLSCHRKDHDFDEIVPERTQLLSDCSTCHY